MSQTLHGTIIGGDLDAVKALVEAGASVNEQTRWGTSMLYEAAENGKTEIVRYLISKGADMNVPGSWQQTPLIKAAFRGHLEVVRVLLEAGADRTCRDRNGITAFLTACGVKGPSGLKIVQMFVETGADVNEEWLHTNGGNAGTPLLWAAQNAGTPTVEFLIGMGARVNVIRDFGTPLIRAIEGKSVTNMAALLAAGADISVRLPADHFMKDWAGKTALEIAQAKKAKKFIELLQSASVGVAPSPAEAKDSDIPALWQRIEKALSKGNPNIRKSLLPGADEAQVRALEALCKVDLPEAFRSSAQIHNGQSDSSAGLITWEDEEFLLLPVESMMREWRTWQELLDGGEFKNQQAVPDEGVRADWCHPGWIPIATDGGGDFLCLDLAPAANGAAGQVIWLKHDSAARPCLARSFTKFLQLIAEQWDSDVE